MMIKKRRKKKLQMDSYLVVCLLLLRLLVLALLRTHRISYHISLVLILYLLYLLPPHQQLTYLQSGRPPCRRSLQTAVLIAQKGNLDHGLHLQ